MRFTVVAGIALWQTAVAGQQAATVGIVVLIGLTYLLPWTHARHERLVSRALANLEPSLATPAGTATPRRPVRATRPGHRDARRTPNLHLCAAAGPGALWTVALARALGDLYTAKGFMGSPTIRGQLEGRGSRS